MPKIFAVVAVLLAAPSLAAAHDFWVERTPEGFLVRYGHRVAEVLAIAWARGSPPRRA